MVSSLYIWKRIKNKLEEMRFKALFFVFFSCSSLTKAQQGILTSGANINNGSGSVSFSIGQIEYKEFSHSSGSIIQGIQQPIDLLLVGRNTITQNELDFRVFPNPGASNIILKVKPKHFENISIQVYDLKGILILEQNLIDPETIIPIDKISPGNYFITVSENHGIVKTLKFIKTE